MPFMLYIQTKSVIFSIRQKISYSPKEGNDASQNNQDSLCDRSGKIRCRYLDQICQYFHFKKMPGLLALFKGGEP